MNILNAPPNSIAVNGKDYPIDTDYKTWINISNMIEELDFVNKSDEAVRDNFLKIAKIINTAYGSLIAEPYADSFSAILKFMRGYPESPKNNSRGDASVGTYDRAYSFKYDINYIILAIRNQSGIDLSYRRTEPFHWWDFLLEFRSLEERHYISKVMGYRTYKGKDKELLRLKTAYALPQTLSKSEQSLMSELDELFFNS